MSPGRLHFIVLLVLASPGIALLVGEALWPASPGALLDGYAVAKIYFLALAAYAALSSLLLMGVWVGLKLRKRPISAGAVLLIHALSIGSILLFLRLGLHDRMERVWERWQAQQLEERRRDQPATPARPRLPQSAPLKPRLPQAPSGAALRPAPAGEPGGANHATEESVQ